MNEATIQQLVAALKLAQRALNTAPSFRVGDTNSYRIAAQVDAALRAAVTEVATTPAAAAKKHFRVYATEVNNHDVLVKAATEEEAESFAKKHFAATIAGTWELTGSEEEA